MCVARVPVTSPCLRSRSPRVSFVRNEEPLIRSNATVVLLGTLDTKGVEYAFLRDRIGDEGVDVVVVDAGVLGPPRTAPDVTKHEVAHAGGSDVDELARVGEREPALEAMARGAAVVVGRLHADGRLQGIAGLGGTGGTAVVAEAMRGLPVGVPKLLVSTVASGDTSSYVGGSDVTMMYSVVDIAGLNRISVEILSNAAGAIAGMAKAVAPQLGESRTLVGASMWGITTPCVTTARERLEELGYEVLVFHQTGIGGRSLEQLVRSGFVTAVLDVTLAELAGELVRGVWPASRDRLEVAGELGIPQVVSPGALDFVAVGPAETLPDRFAGRLVYEHSPAMAGIRTTPDECAELGRTIARKLNGACGPTALFMPLQGVSLMSVEGGLFHDTEADAALFEALREHVDASRVELHELDTHINDPEFALAMADRLHEFHEAWIPA